MSAEIVSLSGTVLPEPAKPEPNQIVVKELELLLEQARAGELVAFAGAYRYREGRVTYSYAGAVGAFALLGALDCVRESILRIAIVE